jgi:hypothetical protein
VCLPVGCPVTTNVSRQLSDIGVSLAVQLIRDSKLSRREVLGANVYYIKLVLSDSTYASCNANCRMKCGSLPHYFSIEDIFATQERLPCKFVVPVHRLGK